MKKFLFRLISVIFVAAVLFLGAVIALNEYLYKDAFPMGVWINNVYCTGMTATEVSQLLESSFDIHSQSIDVRTLDGKVHSLQFDEYGSGFGKSNLIIIGILKALPKPTQVPGCNTFCFSTISLEIFGSISLIYFISSGWVILKIKKLET